LSTIELIVLVVPVVAAEIVEAGPKFDHGFCSSMLLATK
jgi:hypothetical protein